MGVVEEMLEERFEKIAQDIDYDSLVYKMNPSLLNQLLMEMTSLGWAASECTSPGYHFWGIPIEITNDISGWRLEVLQ